MQLTLLTAIVKLFLKKPSETQELVQQVLSLATQVSPGIQGPRALQTVLAPICQASQLCSRSDSRVFPSLPKRLYLKAALCLLLLESAFSLLALALSEFHSLIKWKVRDSIELSRNQKSFSLKVACS